MFFFSSRRRHTRCALVTGVQTCALPIFMPCPSVLVNVRSCRPERGLPVRERAGRTQGDRAHLRISAYIGVCHCGQTAVSKLLYAIWTREIPMRSEERRVGKECVSTCRSRWSPYH